MVYTVLAQSSLILRKNNGVTKTQISRLYSLQRTPPKALPKVLLLSFFLSDFISIYDPLLISRHHDGVIWKKNSSKLAVTARYV